MDKQREPFGTYSLKNTFKGAFKASLNVLKYIFIYLFFVKKCHYKIIFIIYIFLINYKEEIVIKNKMVLKYLQKTLMNHF